METVLARWRNLVRCHKTRQPRGAEVTGQEVRAGAQIQSVSWQPLLIPTLSDACSPDKKTSSKRESVVIFKEAGDEKNLLRSEG